MAPSAREGYWGFSGLSSTAEHLQIHETCRRWRFESSRPDMSKPTVEFVAFPKIARYSRPVIVTEKLDGTNAQIFIDDLGQNIYAGSRNRWIEVGDDNYGFASWVEANKTELLQLGPGSHFGEWWGVGIQRGYGLFERRFSLFNVSRWGDADKRPKCCGVVPTLWTGNFDEMPLAGLMLDFREKGSMAAPGFMKPEGVVIYHLHSKQLFKKTLEADDVPKGAKT